MKRGNKVEVLVDDLEALVRGYHHLPEPSEEYHANDPEPRCVCGSQPGMASHESHQDHMVREALAGVIQL